MTQEIVIFKRIEKWTSRPGVVAIATVLQKTEPYGPYEIDVTSKHKAVEICSKILKSLKIWEKYIVNVVVEAPSDIREVLWHNDGAITFKNIIDDNPGTWRESVIDLAKQYENHILYDYPGRNLQNTLTQIRRDINHYERLLNEFMKL